MKDGEQNLVPSGKKAYEVDLTRREEPAESVEEVFENARKQIKLAFAGSLPEVIEGYVALATGSEDDDVRRKASERILDTFLPPPNRSLQQAPGAGTTIQILNAMPIPETRVIDGKESKMVEVGGRPYALPPATKRIVNAGADVQKKKSQFLGPQHTPASSSPAPAELQTTIIK